MVCPVCHKDDSVSSEHHFWWPKKKYRNTIKRAHRMMLHPKCHRDYHDFYLRHCHRETRQCEKRFVCHYSSVCCYYAGR
jgi:hypothetical protein